MLPLFSRDKKIKMLLHIKTETVSLIGKTGVKCLYKGIHAVISCRFAQRVKTV